MKNNSSGKGKSKLTEKQRRSRANLRKFKPGQSGNPGGKRKGFKSSTAILRAESPKAVPNTPEFQAVLTSLGLKKGCTWAQLDARALRINAAKGNAAAIHELWERLEGKVTSVTEISGPGGAPIPFEFSLAFSNGNRRIPDQD